VGLLRSEELLRAIVRGINGDDCGAGTGWHAHVRNDALPDLWRDREQFVGFKLLSAHFGIGPRSSAGAVRAFDAGEAGDDCDYRSSARGEILWQGMDWTAHLFDERGPGG